MYKLVVCPDSGQKQGDMGKCQQSLMVSKLINCYLDNER